jgi:hypothetical protein
VISSYDGTNTAPTVTDFTNAEVTGVTFANIGSVNSVLAVVSASASDTTAEIQPIVDAYAKVIASADGISNSGSPLNATDFASLGLPAIDTSAKVALMNELIDASTFAEVDTQGELAALADIVAAIIATSSGSTPAVALTVGSFAAIGITGVDAVNLPLMIAAIEASDDDTSGVNTLAKIQAIANQVISTQNAALAVISQYDGNNTEPQISTFTNLGITGVDATNVAAINAYLASISATRSDTIAEVQALVDAFLAVIAAADGNANATPLSFGAAQFALIGAAGINQAAEITCEQKRCAALADMGCLLRNDRVGDLAIFGRKCAAKTAAHIAFVHLDKFEPFDAGEQLARLALDAEFAKPRTGIMIGDAAFIARRD